MNADACRLVRVGAVGVGHVAVGYLVHNSPHFVRFAAYVFDYQVDEPIRTDYYQYYNYYDGNCDWDGDIGQRGVFVGYGIYELNVRIDIDVIHIYSLVVGAEVGEIEGVWLAVLVLYHILIYFVRHF